MGQPTKEIKNDNRPELVDGKQTELQAARELSFIFDHVLNGYHVPFQLRKFLWKILTLTKPGETYGLTDHVLAEQLGGTTRNYVVNLRKKYKVWLNEENENGIRNFPFVSITENTYDKKTNRQKPTEYTFSKAFIELLFSLLDSARNHQKYKYNWQIAIKEVCGSEKNGSLLEFGFWDLRKKKRERSSDNILGTYLINLKRTTRKICQFVTELGFDTQETRSYLEKLLPVFVNESFDEIDELLTFKPNVNGVKIKGSNADFMQFMGLVLNYVNEREEKPITVLPKIFTKPRGENNVHSSNQQQSNNNERRSGKNTGGISANTLSGPLEFDETFYSGKKVPGKTSLDSEYEQFIAKHQTRERKD